MLLKHWLGGLFSSFQKTTRSGEGRRQRRAAQRRKALRDAGVSVGIAKLSEGLEDRTLLAAVLGATLDDQVMGTVQAGDGITYLASVSNSGNMDATNVQLSNPLDPNTDFVPGSLKIGVAAFADNYNVVGNTPRTVAAGSGLLSNDVDIDAGGAFTVTGVTDIGGTAANGSLLVNPDGSFTYTPFTGTNGTDIFEYKVEDSDGLISTGTVTFNVSSMVWFVDNSGPGGGDGSYNNPFNTLAPLNGAGGAGDVDGPGDTIFVYETGTAYLGNFALENNQQLIGDGYAFQIFDLIIGNSSTAPVLTSSSGSNVTLASNNNLRGLNLTSTGGTALFGVNFGSPSVTNMLINATNSVAINLINGNGDFSFNSVNASGAANGIVLDNVNPTAFKITGDNSTTIQGGNDSGGVIQSTTGDAIKLTNSSNITLQNMTIGNPAATVADGPNANVNIADDGVDANNVTNLTLNNVTIAETGTQGVRANAVTNFVMNDSLILNAGNDNEEHAILFTELRGDNFIRRSVFDAFHESGIDLKNATGTVDLTLFDTTFQDNEGSVTFGSQAILMVATGDAKIVARISGTTGAGTKSIFDDIKRNAIHAISEGTASDIQLTVENTRILDTGTGDGMIIMNADNKGSGNITVNNCFFTDDTPAITPFSIIVKNDSSGSLDATITNNTTLGPQLLNINHDDIGSVGAANGTTRALISSNVVDQKAEGSVAIDIIATESGPVGSDPDLSLIITNNTTTQPQNSTFSFAAGLRIHATNNSRVNAQITGNSFQGEPVGSGGAGIELQQLDSSVFKLASPFTGGNAATTAAFINAQNPASQDPAFITGNFGVGLPVSPMMTTTPIPLTIMAPIMVGPTTSTASADFDFPLTIAVPPPGGGTGTGTINLGTIPRGSSTQFRFQANVTKGPGLPNSVSAQGTLTADGGISILTDDPAVGGATDATVTGLESLTLGGTVWTENNSNKTYDLGIDDTFDGVTVNLYLDDGDGILDAGDGAPIATTKTTLNFSKQTAYEFTNLAPGDYIVEVVNSSGPLMGLVSISGTTDPDNNVDNDDNGDPVAGFEVASSAITLDYGTEPGGNVNETLDFGFEASVATSTYSVELSGTNLLVTEDGAGTSDQLTISTDGTNLIITNTGGNLTTTIPEAKGGGTETLTIPLNSAGFTGGVFVSALAGDDTLTLDFSSGNFSRPISFEGGDNGTVGDDLILTGGGTFNDAKFDYKNANDGTVDLTGNSTITYTGLEPITASFTAANVVLSYSTTAETITITDAGGGQTTVNSTAGELTTFNNPTGTLTINAGDTGGDIINLTSLDPSFAATILINGEGGNDTINASVDPGPGAVLTAESVNLIATLNFEIDGTAGANLPGGHEQITVNGAVDLTGSSLATGGSIVGATLGDTFVIINNDGADAVIGTFLGLANGAPVSVNGQTFRIFYDGGDGNDVVLTATGNSPTDIALSNNKIPENAGANAVIGTLSATDPDAMETFTFSLPMGVDDNAQFNINGTQLRTNSSFDFETKSSYTITVRVTDSENLTYDEQFTITVTDVQFTLTLTTNVNSRVEGGTITGTLTRTGSTLLDQTVTLNSSDTTEATVPTTVIIPAGKASVTFTIQAVDDTFADGAQPATITASTTDAKNSQITVTITDNDVSVAGDDILFFDDTSRRFKLGTNKGNTFTWFQSNALPAPSKGYDSFVGDFDGDGDLDGAVRNRDTNIVNVLLNNGDGTLTGPQSRGTAGTSGTAGFFQVGDYDGDGADEILWLYLDGTNSGSVFIKRLTPGGATFFMVTANPDYDAFITGDFNGDGFDDLVGLFDNQTMTATNIIPFFSIASNNPSLPRRLRPLSNNPVLGTFGKTVVGDGLTNFLATDLNGDGKDDLVAVTVGGSTPGQILHSTTTGNAEGDGVVFVGVQRFVSSSRGPIYFPTTFPAPVLVGHFSDDLLSDVLAVDHNGLFQVGVASLNPTLLNPVVLSNPSLNFGSGVTSGQYLVGDFNGDGYDDLVSLGVNATVYLSDGYKFSVDLDFGPIIGGGAGTIGVIKTG
ncbi:MAG: cadherin-like domain-containing protein [Planctomycetaceae bacterium]|nr:cadherin-like domain-containing protein [Planctomycetaceae bacterium]